jgi:hypothetical protein
MNQQLIRRLRELERKYAENSVATSESSGQPRAAWVVPRRGMILRWCRIQLRVAIRARSKTKQSMRGAGLAPKSRSGRGDLSARPPAPKASERAIGA